MKNANKGIIMKEKIILKRNAYAKNEFIYSFIKKQNENKSKLLGNAALHDLDMVIYGYLSGYKKLYMPFLPRIADWLKRGIHSEEKLGNDTFFHQYQLCSTLALAYWFNGASEYIDIWEKATSWLEKMNIDYAHLTTNDDKEFFALQILCYIEAGQYEKVIKLFKLVTKKDTITLSNKMSGYRVAYAYCLYFYDKRFDLDKLEKATKPFLEKHLKMLYQIGRPTEMLFWLKVVCNAREKDYTPEQVLYSFYDYLSEDEKPDFVKDLLAGKLEEKKSFFSFLKW